MLARQVVRTGGGRPPTRPKLRPMGTWCSGRLRYVPSVGSKCCRRCRWAVPTIPPGASRYCTPTVPLLERVPIAVTLEVWRRCPPCRYLEKAEAGTVPVLEPALAPKHHHPSVILHIPFPTAEPANPARPTHPPSTRPSFLIFFWLQQFSPVVNKSHRAFLIRILLFVRHFICCFVIAAQRLRPPFPPSLPPGDPTRPDLDSWMSQL
ncbi:hypothetical protein F5B21DRAFT_383212 [Xylaria acuta]|nr:hypothetical protein F5B21DRAFT_383212 [Xylaria acuta]